MEHTGSFTSPSTTHGDGLRAAVQSEVAGDGLISFHLSSPGYITHYRSREYSDATKRPTLSVTYFEP